MISHDHTDEIMENCSLKTVLRYALGCDIGKLVFTDTEFFREINFTKIFVKLVSRKKCAMPRDFICFISGNLVLVNCTFAAFFHKSQNEHTKCDILWSIYFNFFEQLLEYPILFYKYYTTLSGKYNSNFYVGRYMSLAKCTFFLPAINIEKVLHPKIFWTPGRSKTYLTLYVPKTFTKHLRIFPV